MYYNTKNAFAGVLTIILSMVSMAGAANASVVDEKYPTLRDVLELMREHNEVNHQFIIDNATINGVPIPIQSLIFKDLKNEDED